MVRCAVRACPLVGAMIASELSFMLETCSKLFRFCTCYPLELLVVYIRLISSLRWLGSLLFENSLANFMKRSSERKVNIWLILRYY